MGILHVRKRTEAEGVNFLQPSGNNCTCNRDDQVRLSGGDNGQEEECWRLCPNIEEVGY